MRNDPLAKYDIDRKQEGGTSSHSWPDLPKSDPRACKYGSIKFSADFLVDGNCNPMQVTPGVFVMPTMPPSLSGPGVACVASHGRWTACATACPTVRLTSVSEDASTLNTRKSVNIFPVSLTAPAAMLWKRQSFLLASPVPSTLVPSQQTATVVLPGELPENTQGTANQSAGVVLGDVLIGVSFPLFPFSR